MSRAILWFRNDLRLADNAALTAACAAHEEVLPVLIIDPRQHGASPLGFDRSGPFRRRFLKESIADLDAQLRAKGSALHVRVGEPAAELAHLSEVWGTRVVHAQHLHAWEEQEQERAASVVIDLHLHAPNTLLLPGDLPFTLDKLPHVFTAFRHKVETRSPVRDLLAEPELVRSPAAWKGRALEAGALPVDAVADDPRAVMRFIGGRTAGLRRLAHYLGPELHLSHYKETRNALLGADNSSKLSPWLANGSLGAREVWHAVKCYEAEHGANESTYWLVFELLWRDFFQFTAAKHERELFLRGGIARKPPTGNADPRRFAAWCEGRTGQPFIDANMRELAATGWMSNRGRQNVASYLVHDLGLDWRMGAWWFEHHLIDHDPCSNWGNWQYVAGVGNDPREGRRFDPERQAGMYDADGSYVRHWGPR
jgi:deoxyribodipyrimidine photo-lyase